MTNTVKTVVLYLVRILVLWVVDALSLLATAWLLPGMTISAVGDMPATLVAVSAALLLAIVNLLIRPVILLLARPLGWIALFVVGFLVNAVALWMTAWLLPGFDVDCPGRHRRRYRLCLLQRQSSPGSWRWTKRARCIRTASSTVPRNSRLTAPVSRAAG